MNDDIKEIKAVGLRIKTALDREFGVDYVRVEGMVLNKGQVVATVFIQQHVERIIRQKPVSKIPVKPSIPREEQEDNRQNWNLYCRDKGFTKRDYGRKFIYNKQEYTLQSITIHSPKNCIIAWSHGKYYKFSAEAVKKHLSAKNL